MRQSDLVELLMELMLISLIQRLTQHLFHLTPKNIKLKLKNKEKLQRRFNLEIF